MNSFLGFVKTMFERPCDSNNVKVYNPNNNAQGETRSENMNKVLSNEELVNTLRLLKKDGISYRYIAHKTDIRESTFYSYLNRGEFPFLTRKIITEYIDNNLKEILNNV